MSSQTQFVESVFHSRLLCFLFRSNWIFNLNGYKTGQYYICALCDRDIYSTQINFHIWFLFSSPSWQFRLFFFIIVVPFWRVYLQTEIIDKKKDLMYEHPRTPGKIRASMKFYGWRNIFNFAKKILLRFFLCFFLKIFDSFQKYPGFWIFSGLNQLKQEGKIGIFFLLYWEIMRQREQEHKFIETNRGREIGSLHLVIITITKFFCVYHFWFFYFTIIYACCLFVYC